MSLNQFLCPLTACAHALAELHVEQLFGDAVVSHAFDVSCPSDVSFAHDGVDAGNFRTLKNFSVRNFVLPPEMETIRLFFITSVDGPSVSQPYSRVVRIQNHNSVHFEFPSPIPGYRSKSPKCAGCF